MNDREKEVEKYALKQEKTVLSRLKEIFLKAKNATSEKIKQLELDPGLKDLQSKINQLRYQKILEAQLDAALKGLDKKAYQTADEYIRDQYDTGFVGGTYSMHGQGVPLMMPIDYDLVEKAVTLDSKLSKPLYESMGENVRKLKKDIQTQVSTGIIQGKSWIDVANGIAGNMTSPFSKASGRALTIARTEGHRVRQAAAYDQHKEAKEYGADVIRQWDATMDRHTRRAHAVADGSFEDEDGFFSVGGEKIRFPGMGSAKNACNCRCVAVSRAKWALDDEDLKELEDRAKYFGLDKADNFEDFKSRYLGYNSQITNYAKAIDSLTLDKSYGYNRYTK